MSVPAAESPVPGQEASRRHRNIKWRSSKFESQVRQEHARIWTGAWPIDPSHDTEIWSHLPASAIDKVLVMSSEPEIIEGLQADSRAAMASNGREARGGSRELSLT
jgi:hypothetical protein